ncbi:MAG: tRNA (guanosine(46)-N7)-methyltransferase TrmB [Pseudomonadota bacterium]
MTARENSSGADLETDADLEAGPIRSFGRRRARKLSQRQQSLLDNLLPRISALGPNGALRKPLEQAVTGSARPTWLEIGFGGSEHLIWQARQNADVQFIGCEPFIDGVAKALTSIDEVRLTNVALHADDVWQVLRALPDQTLDRVFILFPDPWPKKRHVKRRLVSPALLDELARLMKPGTELRIGTDIADYARTILLTVHTNAAFEWPVSGPDDWRVRPTDWPQTRYEAKAVREGRSSSYFSFRRR